MVAIGISAGFASVFGTPLAGAVFGLEVIVVGRMRYEAILPSFLSAAVASMVCHAWGVEHTHYVVSEVPFPDASNLLWTIGAGILFGLAAMLFSRSIGFWSGMAKRISYLPFRPPDRRTCDSCSCLDDGNYEIYRFGCYLPLWLRSGAADVV